MKFTRRNLGLFPDVKIVRARPVGRPEPCRPTLGMERCEERTLLSIALVSVNADGDRRPQRRFRLRRHDARRPGSLRYSPTQSNPGEPERRRNEAGVRQRCERPGRQPRSVTTNQASDVFVRDSTTGQTSLVSATPDGQPGNGDSFDPAISPNGRYVAFVSLATNLTASSQPALAVRPFPTRRRLVHLYVRDLQTGRRRFLTRRRAGRRRTASAPVSSSSVRTVRPSPGSIPRTT